MVLVSWPSVQIVIGLNAMQITSIVVLIVNILQIVVIVIFCSISISSSSITSSISSSGGGGDGSSRAAAIFFFWQQLIILIHRIKYQHKSIKDRIPFLSFASIVCISRLIHNFCT